jgi:type IV pilus assembly protein PilX
VEFLNRSLVHRQRGLSLLFALLSLAVLTLASIALIRSVSMGAMLAGNLGFQQEATAAADVAVRQALAVLSAKLTASSTSLGASQPSLGYYAYSDDLIDVTGSQLSVATRKLVKWDSYFCATQSGYASCAFTPVSVSSINGNTPGYVVFRMCDREGDPVSDTTINCARPLSSSSSSSTNEVRDYNSGAGTSASIVSPYYRIVVRVVGARNTTSYTETIVHF